MKLARELELKRFLEWLDGWFGTSSGVTEDLLRLSLLYALNADSSLGIEKTAIALNNPNSKKRP